MLRARVNKTLVCVSCLRTPKYDSAFFLLASVRSVPLTLVCMFFCVSARNLSRSREKRAVEAIVRWRCLRQIIYLIEFRLGADIWQ